MGMFNGDAAAGGAATTTQGDDATNQPNESNPGGNTVQGDNTGEATQDRLDQSGKGDLVEGQTYDDAQRQQSVSDLGINVEQVQDSDPKARVLAEIAAAGALAKTDVKNLGEVIYSSHPIQNLMIGAYHFKDTVLRLKHDMVEDFEAMLDKLPPQDRLNIRKIDTDAAAQIVQDRMDANTQATRAFDSSVGRSALAAMQAANPTVGTKAIDDMEQPAPGFAQNAGNQTIVMDTAGGEADSRAE